MQFCTCSEHLGTPYYVKKLFIILLITLISASVFTFFFLPENEGDLPVVHWVIQPDPIRGEQIVKFTKWMEENDYPAMDLRLDARAKNQHIKNVVQGVSGVAADIIDCYTGEINLYESVGMLEDVTDVAKEMGFDISMTYPAIQSSLMVDGRQYGFPRNVGIRMYWVNVGAFEKVGAEAPPESWSFEEFERIGKAFVQASNKPGEHQSVYFANTQSVDDRVVMMRSMGEDRYNETLTDSNFDHPVYQEIAELSYKWTNHDRILPTKKDVEALSSETGATRVIFQQFAHGHFGMIVAGRWGLMHFRAIGPHKLSISELPINGFRNTLITCGTSAIYKGSKHKAEAAYFLKYMASEAYNMSIVDNTDSLPPIPRYAETEEFLRPAEFPNEWGLHGKIRDLGMESAIAYSMSPFALPATVARIEKNGFDKLLAGRLSPEDALKAVANEVRQVIVRNADESAKKLERYQNGLRDQKEIERLRSEGKLVPLELIQNPFYRKYYVLKGWALPEGGEAQESQETIEKQTSL
jgi:multiple sugar transport system substrate-binding protein